MRLRIQLGCQECNTQFEALGLFKHIPTGHVRQLCWGCLFKLGIMLPTEDEHGFFDLTEDWENYGHDADFGV